MKWFRFPVWSSLLAFLAVAGVTSAVDGPPPTKNKAFLQAVPQASVSIEPSTPTRGQTATWKLTLDLAPGWYTYPTEQPAPEAATNKTTFVFPPPGEVVFVGELGEPPVKTKSVEGLGTGLGTTEVRYLEGKVEWQRPLVVSPQAKPGETKVNVQATVIVCNQKGQCLLPVKLNFEVPVTISDAPPVPVEDRYKSELAALRSTPTPSPPESGGDGGSDGRSPTVVDKTEKGLLGFIAAGAIWGAISLLTPCVFPMIPITVSFFLKQSEKTHHRPLGMALTYSLTIV